MPPARVDAFHANETEVAVDAVIRRSLGMDCGLVFGVVNVIAIDWPGTFPDVSNAVGVWVYVSPLVKPWSV